LVVGIHDPLRDGLVGQLVVLAFNVWIALRSSGPLGRQLGAPVVAGANAVGTA
jgi:hypothetical protein